MKNFSIDYYWAPTLLTNDDQALIAVHADSAVQAYTSSPASKVGDVGNMRYTQNPNILIHVHNLTSKVTSGYNWTPSGDPFDPSCIPTGCSPIVIDLDNDGIEFGPRDRFVAFDMTGDGRENLLQWVARGGDEGILVLDRNGNGVIDTGAEMFGNFTPMELSENETAEHGYEALAQYDDEKLGGDGDGAITSGDSIWQRLGIWQDVNADALSQKTELTSLSSWPITRMGIDPEFKKDYWDTAGNWIPYWDWAYCEGTDKCEVRTVDVFFRGPYTE